MKSKKSEGFEWIQAIVIALILAYIIKLFFFEIIEVEGKSMYPTLHDKDRLIISKIDYIINEPDVGDIVTFKYPADESLDFIKRIVAKEGDTVEIKDNYLFVNGEKVIESYINEKLMEEFQIKTIPENSFFVLGDNRNKSRDSRYRDVSFLDEDNIKGKAIIRVWPFKSIGILEKVGE